jgi:hypothetical protein
MEFGKNKNSKQVEIYKILTQLLLVMLEFLILSIISILN